MSNPQNPYGSGDGSGGNNPNGQNPNGQPPSAPGFGNDQNSGQQPPQYGSQPSQPNYGQGSNNGSQDYGQQPPQYGSQPQQGSQPQYGSQPQQGSQPQYGAGYDQNQYDQNQYGQGQFGQNQAGSQPQYGGNQYGQGQYDANAQGYDPNQYGQQPAYSGAEGSSDQFIPANPNAAYGQFPSGTGGNTSKNIWGILALIGGIVGILTSGFLFGGLLGVAAVVFGFIALSAIKKGLASNKGVSITGLILGFVAILFSIIALVFYMFLGVGFISAIDQAASQSPTTSPSQGAEQDPSQGSNDSGSSDGGEAAPASGSEVTIGDDLTAQIQVRPGTVEDTASGAQDSNGQVAIVTMTVKNSSSSDVDLTLTSLKAENASGTPYKDVFDGKDFRGSLAFADPVPAGGETTYEFAYGVPKDEIDGLHLKLSLIDDLGAGKDFEFYKQ